MRRALRPLAMIAKRAARLWRDVAKSGGGRFWSVAVMAALAATLQGGGLLTLHPILQALGMTGDAPPRFPMLADFGRAVGLGGALACYAGFVTATAALLHAQNLAALRLVIEFGDRTRSRLYHAIVNADWALAAKARPADLARSLTVEVEQCGWAVDQALRLFATALQAPALILVALMISPAFTLLCCGLAIAAALLLLPFNGRRYAIAAGLASANRALHAEVTDELAGLRILKVLGAESQRSAAFFERVATLRAKQIDQARASSLAIRAQISLGAATIAFAIWFGTEVLGQTLADVLVLALVFARILMLGQRAQDQGRQIIRVLPVYENLRRRIAAYSAKPEPQATRAPVLQREIRLDGVGYRYGADGPWALRGVAATIPARSVTALVGPSGAGKSTLADLLMGLSEAQEGRILIDGAPLDPGARIAWRRRVAYVPQDPFLFHDSIRANLLLARPAAREQDLWRALDQASAGFVRGLPEGLDAVVGERGTRLSGGERQRIALARALLQEPDLLVLDEATSALDDETEREILRALSDLRGHVTMLVIAHRSASIALADQRIELSPQGGARLS